MPEDKKLNLIPLPRTGPEPITFVLDSSFGFTLSDETKEYLKETDNNIRRAQQRSHLFYFD